MFGCGVGVVVSQTCGESRLGGGFGNYDGEGSGGRRRLGPGQGAVPGEADRQTSSFYGGLVVPQLVDALLLQQQSLLLPHATQTTVRLDSRQKGALDSQIRQVDVGVQAFVLISRLHDSNLTTY